MNENSLGVEKHHFSFENGMWRCFGLTPVCPYNGYGKTPAEAFAVWKRGERLIAGKKSYKPSWV